MHSIIYRLRHDACFARELTLTKIKAFSGKVMIEGFKTQWRKVYSFFGMIPASVVESEGRMYQVRDKKYECDKTTFARGQGLN